MAELLGVCTCNAPRHMEHLNSCAIWENARRLECKGTPKTDTSAERKDAPLYSGCLSYFPLALLAVARLSKKANDKHNPGEPLHWSREKSNDHLDCAARHLLNPEEIDPEFNEPHAVAHAWRALAALQLIEEKRLGKTT